jgi:Fur family ferric uptake transcriptional regulator
MPVFTGSHALPATGPEWPALDAWLTQAGLRRTRATLAVMHLFVSDAGLTATHADVALAMTHQGEPVNRVTLYRLLDRLVTAGLLARQSDDVARTWRYRLADLALAASVDGLDAVDGARAEPPTGPGVVPRFECDACHRQVRLTDASQPTQQVAQQLLQALADLGHQGQRVDLSIHGTCAVCITPDNESPLEQGT